ncbi:MAG: DUF4920 domain-containing protein [Deltaproteobacteria bacterium]|nr:DUF4920 domain-containing protein [Deltaproteobacteria bacterium]MBW2387415.1 DUF4920 domain-containing protein [Deltaproteobacteria bacterium]MBW2723860.1 DUF4920 domain-containing protein [Deltaproteobacteria bacterium]
MQINSLWIVTLLVALPLIAGAEPPVDVPTGPRLFGAPLVDGTPTPIGEILRDPERFAGQTVLLRGRITDLCQKKGCWTVITDDRHAIRVRFQDYGFFLPKDSVGVEAWAQGTVSVRSLSERDARHYASESRDGDPSRIKGPQREVGFTATGVRLAAGD